MGKFDDLKKSQLKKELEARNLITYGNKSVLQARLLKAMEASGVAKEEYEFPAIPSNKCGDSSVPTDMNALLGAIAGVQDSLIQNTSQVEDMQKRIEESLVKNSKQLEERIQKNASLLEERMQNSSLQMEERTRADLAVLRDSLIENSKIVQEKLSRIEENSIKLQARQDKVETEFQALQREVKNELQTIHKKLEADISRLDECFRELRWNDSASSIGTAKLELPTFDGTMPFNIFKLQFEMAATSYKWSVEDKLAALIVALKGPAMIVLQTVEKADRADYDAIISALEKYYGSEHWRRMHQMKLVSRTQKDTETLQEYANDIERLTLLAHSDIPVDYLDRVKIQSFIKGVRDLEIKRALYATPKSTFVETVSFAVTQETAKILSDPAKSEDVREQTTLQPTMLELLQSLSQLSKELKNGVEAKCITCEKCVTEQ
ncbi:uncharacterized protein LOC118735615 isoform X1 [Rhagoletis pomonella]|uniref:uncharacterized protein LOC118735615 isoform X1 n=2 Tax=Rhagoletis pomonella TaxID=28610 RepID=UPI0017821657|nr:uncharacterized protein LOC118735615 isoform X1 [Rhagoletis pomonella]XP_036321361.1 uncharacterized protein LOC118735615 isoform X1 [Rhagoletis pomonella]